MLEKLADIPERPGVYLFRDVDGRVLYVGKAKGLKSRVRSYFQKSSSLDERKSAMVKSVRDFEYTLTGNELEAFILEATLIKQLRPRYNILLRDDKSYPYLRLTLNEKWPRLEVVRRIKKDGAKYYGPYVPAGDMWNILSFIRNNFRIPTCKHSLDKRMRPCIQQQIKRCIAPCDGRVEHDEYMKAIAEIRLILEGKNNRLLKSLEDRMAVYSEELRFEEAALLRDRIRSLRKVSESQKMVAPDLGDVDVIGMSRRENRVAFKLLFIRNGIMTGYRQFIFSNAAGETDGYLMKNLIEQFYLKEIIPPALIACSVLPEDRDILALWLADRKGGKVSISVPARGIKRRLADMAGENAEILLKTEKDSETGTVNEEIAGLLGLEDVPSDIGAFDISNISGREPVGSFVYWADGDFRKENYRHIRMDAVAGPDDYAMMREMVRRTLGKSNDKEEREKALAQGAGEIEAAPREDRNVTVPDLIIIDGGMGQLEAALTVMDECGIRTGVISIAKDPDRVFFPGQDPPLRLEDGSRAALLLKRIRDEAHRFAITYHKKRRALRTFESPLDKIPGVGKKRRLALLRHFGSIDSIRNASPDELMSLKGVSRKFAEKISASVKNNKEG